MAFVDTVDMRFVSLQLLEEIATAENWHHIAKATEALFHARMHWKSMQRERKQFEVENGMREHSAEAAAPRMR